MGSTSVVLGTENIEDPIMFISLLIIVGSHLEQLTSESELMLYPSGHFTFSSTLPVDERYVVVPTLEAGMPLAWIALSIVPDRVDSTVDISFGRMTACVFCTHTRDRSSIDPLAEHDEPKSAINANSKNLIDCWGGVYYVQI